MHHVTCTSINRTCHLCKVQSNQLWTWCVAAQAHTWMRHVTCVSLRVQSYTISLYEYVIRRVLLSCYLWTGHAEEHRPKAKSPFDLWCWRQPDALAKTSPIPHGLHLLPNAVLYICIRVIYGYFCACIYTYVHVICAHAYMYVWIYLRMHMWIYICKFYEGVTFLCTCTWSRETLKWAREGGGRRGGGGAEQSRYYARGGEWRRDLYDCHSQRCLHWLRWWACALIDLCRLCMQRYTWSLLFHNPAAIEGWLHTCVDLLRLCRACDAL